MIPKQVAEAIRMVIKCALTNNSINASETAVLVVYNCISTTRLTGLTHNSYFFQNNWQCFDQTVLWPAWCALVQFSVLA